MIDLSVTQKRLLEIVWHAGYHECVFDPVTEYDIGRSIKDLENLGLVSIIHSTSRDFGQLYVIAYYLTKDGMATYRRLSYIRPWE